MTPGRAPNALIDTNLLVLYVVGSVNRSRIETFKRTSQYGSEDYDLLIRLMGKFRSIYTLAHIMAEVSNLTDLPGPELLLARRFLRATVMSCHELAIPSGSAVDEPSFERLGLTDAAIACAAREHNCVVLTDDLHLYLDLSKSKTRVYNFTHLRAQGLA